MGPIQEAAQSSIDGGVRAITKIRAALATLGHAVCYEYDDLGEDEIRLLKVQPGKGSDILRCKVIRVSLHDPPE